MNIIYILLPLPLSTGAYAYGINANTPIPSKGMYVSVPLGKKVIVGVVWDKTDDKKIPLHKIKMAEEIHDFPPMKSDMIDTITFMSGYTLTPLGACLKLALPMPSAITEPKKITSYTLANPIPIVKQSSARQKIIDSFSIKHTQTTSEVKAYGSPSVIKGLVENGVLIPRIIRDIIKPKIIDTNYKQTPLSKAQEHASQIMIEAIGSFKPIVLDGITGSGKTEVYFEALAKCLDQGKQVLVLLPEIALSSQWLKRFAERFGCDPAVWHSEITPARRRDIWTGVAFSTVKVVVGARSALHLPFQNLGFIVVDEEHDSSYKQEDGVLYNARDMAVFRAKSKTCPVILSSATPSLETWDNIVSKRYIHLQLTERFGNSTPPDIELLDIKADKMEAQTFITPTLKHKMQENLDKGLQTMLFLNRRGYAPLTLCRSCGHRFECNSCRAWLVQHKFNASLHCHHCGFNQYIPNACPECGDTESLHACGPGVERIAEEVENTFPNARVFLATSESMSTPTGALNFVQKMENGDIDIVIGTQIIAKGYHFSNLTLVGVIDGDMALSGGDLRAGERTFQMLQQVSGRAGRSDIQGHAYIQTTNPQHPILLALADDDRDAFLNLELKLRQMSGQPPFHRLVPVIVSDSDRTKCEHAIKQLAYTAPRNNDVRILGPSEPHMPFLRGKHRRRLLINMSKMVKAQPLIWAWIQSTQKNPTMGISSSTRIQIDVDPYSFF